MRLQRVGSCICGCLAIAVREVLPHKGLDAGSTANGCVRGATVLDYNEAWFAVRVVHLRAAQLVFCDDVLNRQEAVR